MGVELTVLPERNAFLSRSTWLSIFTSGGPDALANDEDDAIPPFLLLLPILPNCEQDADETSCGGATVAAVLPTIWPAKTGLLESRARREATTPVLGADIGGALPWTSLLMGLRQNSHLLSASRRAFRSKSSALTVWSTSASSWPPPFFSRRRRFSCCSRNNFSLNYRNEKYDCLTDADSESFILHIPNLRRDHVQRVHARCWRGTIHHHCSIVQLS